MIFVLATAALCGCSFVRYDTERAMQQEIATVDSYKIVNAKVDKESGNTQEFEYVTPQKTLYLRDLVEYVNNNSSSLSSSFSGDLKGMYEYAARMLINIELVTNEVDALISSGLIKWTLTDQNNIKKNIYSVIDNTLFSLKNAVLTERGMEPATTDSETAETPSTTYPVKPEVEDEDDTIEKTDKEVWTPNAVSCPGIAGDSDKRSLEREAMRRYLSLIKARVQSDFRLDRGNKSWLRPKIENEIKAIDMLIDTQGIESVYPVIGSYGYPMKDYSGEYGYIMYYLSGESLERSQKIKSLQAYLSESVTVAPDEVEKRFTTTLNEQKSLYSSDVAAYNTAINDDTKTVLYNANSNYFYVKHILLPFSEDQKTALTAFKDRPDIKNLQKDEKDKKVNEYRETLAESIVCYRHKDGEDDKTKSYTVSEVMAHIRSEMTPRQGNVERANEAFNDLIYLYNTDPGAFGKDKGYIVKYKLDKDESETYQKEFADAARYMYENLSVGQFYDKAVITDYGVHVMYLSSVVAQGNVSLYGYTSPNKSETYYDVIEKPIRTERENAAYTNWENNIFAYNYQKYSKTYPDNFSKLWEG